MEEQHSTEPNMSSSAANVESGANHSGTCPIRAAKVNVVDFGPFLDGGGSERDRKGVALSLLDSFKTIGFVVLINHPIPRADVDEMFEWVKRLFALPLEVKQLAPHPKSGAHHRGYSAVGRENIKEPGGEGDGDQARRPSDISEADEGRSTATRSEGPAVDHIVREYKESFESGKEDDIDMPNIWYPDNVLPGFKEACLKYYWTCYEAEKTVLRALALGFDLPEDYFLQFHSRADNQLRLLHYPSIPSTVLEHEQASRIPSHSDYGSLTMLVQDDIGGLEVEDPNRPGAFIPVPTVPGALVVNAGDFLMRWSNDTIRSTVHRVRSPPLSIGQGGMLPARYSIPYFCGPDMDTVVECIPGTWSEPERPKRYPPVSGREYILQRLAGNYG